MLGSTELTAVLGSGVDPTNHEAVRSYIRNACDAGLAILLIVPGTKRPFDGRTARKRAADDKAAQQAAREAGRRDWQKVKSPSGLALATTDKNVITRKGGYLDHYIATYGEDCAVNLAIEVGASRMVVVDCDTEEQKRRFLETATGDPDSDLPPTVISPGSRDAQGNWVHANGGHYWFTVPEEWQPPTNLGAMTWGGDDGFAVLWHRRYVLIPPSTRPEGAYEMLGREYPVPMWLRDAIDEKASAKLDRALASTPAVDDMATAIDEWAESVDWADILEPLGWTPTARPDNCGCDVWTAPGNHTSPKSATAHDSGCQLGRYTETNAPLHIWTDNPGEPFATYIESTGSQTLSKLQAVAYASYDGNVGAAMDSLGLGPSLHAIERETGVSQSNIDAAADVDTAALDEPIDLPTPSLVEQIDQIEAEAVELEEAGEFEAFVPDEDADFPDEAAKPDPDVFDTGISGLPIIAPFSHWRDLPPPEYVIEGLVEHGGLSMMIGPPGVGKSSVALDMACCIATGRPWQGRKTLKTRVLYLPGEGQRGANQRMKAWVAAHDIPDAVLDDGIRVGNGIIQLGASTEAWGLLAEYIIRQRIGLIVFDTFARMSLGIEENSATEVGRAVVRFDQIRQLTNAGVLIVHHTAKNNPTSARGSGALQAAVDSELLISEGAWDFEQFGLVDADGRVPSGKKIQLDTTKQKNTEQLDSPIPMLMRNFDRYDAPYITGVNGEIDPMVGDITLARPVEEPVLETAVRIRKFVDQFPEQGVTRSDITTGVAPDAFTRSRKDATKAWRHKVAVAIDRAITYDLIETASGQRLGARYVPGTATIEAARTAHARSVLDGDEDTDQ